MQLLDKNFTSYFYVGRIYQKFLDSEEDLVKGLIPEIGLILPKTKDVDIKVVKRMLTTLLDKEGVAISCKTLPRRCGWRISLSICS